MLIIPAAVITMLVSGCATNIEKIEKNKQVSVKSKIKISQPDEQKTYKVYVDQSNKLKYLCHVDVANKCDYETEEKHSYENGTPLEEVFWINDNGYYPSISPNTKGIQCGIGSLWGWIAIFNNSEDLSFPALKYNAITNYNKRNPHVCNSRFSELDSTQIFQRLGVGLVTFFTPLVTAGNMHTREFDQEAFLNSIYVSNIETFKNELIEKTNKFNIHGGLDVIYLRSSDIKNVLENKYDSLLKDNSKKAGIIFIDEDSNKLLATIIFDKYKDENLIASISLQISDLINDLSTNDSLALDYNDILPYIPDEIPLPQIPAIPTLVKDEFENRSNFKKRVEAAVEKREREIRNLQRKYSLDVFERNAYVDNLQQSFNRYLDEKSEDKNNFLIELEGSIMELSKVLFLENTSGYSATNFKYNAEEEKLYFEIYSKNKGFSQEVVAEISPEVARKIKLENTFKIIPEIKAENKKIQLSGFDIVDLTSNTSYETIYTNVSYKPEVVSVSVVGLKENIRLDVSNHFKQYKQKDSHIVDTSEKEIWYVDVAKSINAKVPQWFSNPTYNDKVVGYGEGKTLNEAKSNARNDLAFMVKVKVNTVLENTNKINNFKSFSEIKESTQQSSNIELSSTNYKLLKQDSIDGRWYVGLEYLSSASMRQEL